MAETVRQVEERIAMARERLAVDLNELQEKVETVTDWRHQMGKHPYLWLGAAFVAGFALSKPSRGVGRVSRALRAETGTPTFDKFMGAFTALAVDRAKDYVEKQLPGFSRAFDRVPPA